MTCLDLAHILNRRAIGTKKPLISNSANLRNYNHKLIIKAMGNLKIIPKKTQMNEFACYCYFTSKSCERFLYSYIADNRLFLSPAQSSKVNLI